jgi:chaperonin cofactor prefoldin
MTHLETLKRISNLEQEAYFLELDLSENKEYKKLVELRSLSQDFKLRRSIAGYFVDKNLIHYVTLLEEINDGLVNKVHVIEKKSRLNTEFSLEQMQQCSDENTEVYSSMRELDRELSFYLLELEDDGIFKVL